MKDIVIVSALRTPMGSFMGGLSTVSATDLGATVVKATLSKANIQPKEVDEVFMGQVLQAGVGQAPARQVAINAGLGVDVPATTVNKVCSSGMKSIIMGAQSIQAGDNEVVVTGGMESMSQVPSYLKTNRTGQKLGNQSLEDGLLLDGLINVYDGQHMGNCGELCAKEFEVSREEQDAFAIESYQRAAAAWNGGKFKNEIAPVEVPQRKGDPIIVDEDEEYKNVSMEKIPNLRPVFEKQGTITAANASTLNDGASSIILMSAEKAKQLGVKPLARIVSYADAALEPERFTNAPTLAARMALEKASMSIEEMDYIELNEAFAVVGIANIKMLGADPKKVNVWGGAVSLGHPLGNSGCRIVVTLLSILEQNDGKYGLAAICNGGGGASAIIVEKM